MGGRERERGGREERDRTWPMSCSAGSALTIAGRMRGGREGEREGREGGERQNLANELLRRVSSDHRRENERWDVEKEWA